MRIGEVIKKARIAQNITQEELATALHITPQAVSRWENGLSYPDTPMLPLIAQYLNISTDKLLGHTTAEIINDVEILNQSQIDSIFDYIPGKKGTYKNILVVDDADFMRKMLTDILSSEGHSIITAQNGKECLDILQTRQTDICILDINMPIMDGFQTLEIIRKKYPKLKIIMLSVQSTGEAVKRALALGANGFVAKPFAPQSVLERMG